MKTKVDEKAAKDADTLWAEIAGIIVCLIPSNTPGLDLEELAEDVVRIMTGRRQSQLDKRISELGELGSYGSRFFRALSSIRLRKALLILNAIKTYLGRNTDLSEDKKRALVPAIMEIFREGSRKIQDYEGSSRSIGSFPPKGIRIAIVDGGRMVEAEVVPDELVGLDVDSNQALMVLHGPYKGACATPGNLSKLYRMLFPEDDSKFVTAHKYFWNTGPWPAVNTDKALEVAKDAWSIGRVKDRVISKDRVYVERDPEYNTPLKLIRTRREPVWKEQVPFEDFVNKCYVRELQNAPKKEPVETKKERKLEIDLGRCLPASYEKFEEEYKVCLFYISSIEKEIAEFSSLCRKLEEAQNLVLKLQAELKEADIQQEDLQNLRKISERWDRIYSCIPRIADTLEGRGQVVQMIEDILRPLVGENEAIFKMLEERYGN